MKPRGPLMIEHRLIERMLRLMNAEVGSIVQRASVDPVFIDAVVDFIRTYADRTHHGKEEEILFKELEKKRLRDADRAMMNDLVEEHRMARDAVKELVRANRNYADGDMGALHTVKQKLEWLIVFYPPHIRKEDKIFFPNTETYFTEEELGKMLEEFREFDRTMIHERYGRLVDELKPRFGE